MEGYCQRRWGGSGWTHHLKSEGKKDGAMFSNWKWWPNTLKGHQLIHFLNENYNIDTNLANAILFNAMYEQGKNIASSETLVDIAIQELNAPLKDKDMLKHFLDNDLGADNVQRDIGSSREEYDISGVPFFIISNNEDSSSRPYGLSGAQSSSTFLNIFKQLTE